MKDDAPAAFNPIGTFIDTPQVPDAARHRAATLLLDTIGVAAGAHDLAPARIARDYAYAFHAPHDPSEGVPILFDGRATALPGAAFAAATQIDNLDAHDGFNPVKGHIGCAVVPALLAFAHSKPQLSGPDALDLLVMAYEVGARAGLALHASVADYHTSGAWNALAVAALGCRLHGATRKQMREALGIAEYHGPRSQMMREIAHPTMLHDGSGMGALTGSMAVLLALRGFEGAPAITLEAPEAAPFWADLGTRWTILENYIKPYPVCRWAHAPLDALKAVMQKNALAPEDIAQIDVGTFTESAALYPHMPQTTGQAQYSLHFALATLWRHGTVGPEHVSGAALTDGATAALLPRINVTVSPRHDAAFPAHRMADVTITLKDGRKLHSGDVHARGSPDAPLPDAEVEAKFLHYATPTLGQTKARSLWSLRDRLLEDDAMFSELTLCTNAAP